MASAFALPGFVATGHRMASGLFALHRARRIHDHRDVLLATLAVPASPAAALAALEREYESLGMLAGRGAPRPLDLIRGSTPALILEDRGFRTLRDVLRRGTVPLDQAFRLAESACVALDALHQRDVEDATHGGLTPDVLLVADSDPPIHVLDIGGARRMLGPASASLDRRYISPELSGRIDRDPDYRSDFYALGAILYELFTGVPPFTSADELELVHAHIARTPANPHDVNARVPVQLGLIVLKLLAKAPDDRYQSAAGIRHDLEQCAAEWHNTGAVSLFPLAQGDVSDRLLVPQRLYGRDQDVAALVEAFERTCAGSSSLLLVAGYSGIGKTSLITELYRPIVRERGVFASGKFDQIARHIPYGALIQALRSLVQQVLAQPEAELLRWKQELAQALGANGAVVTEVIPEIELVLGTQPAVPPLDPTAARNRFHYTFRRFIQTFARPNHPLVLFLDDLQWVDAATLDLLHALLTVETRHVLIVGAYRDNEVDAHHRLTWATEHLSASGTPVTRVTLSPLSQEHVLAFLADTLHEPPEALESLAALVLRKTDGNPFFVIQFLTALRQNRLLTFDPQGRRWTFAIDAIRGAQITDNVVDLMMGRIRRLPPRAQRVVTLAACIGSSFDAETLALAGRLSPDDVGAGIGDALDAGLITGGPAYTFLHDRVQQAAYALIAPSSRTSVHLEAGRRLRDRAGSAVTDERIFAIVNHMNIGAALIEDSGERTELARLNLAAGARAKASAAYRAAAVYFDAGLAAAPDLDWGQDYDLLFSLTFEAAQAHYLAGAFADAERSCDTLLARARTGPDRARVHGLRIVVYENLSRFSEAIASGREALALFGLSLPETDASTQAALDATVDAIRDRLGERPIATLSELPPMADADMRVAMSILTTLWAPSYVCGNHRLARLISATMVRLSLEYGNTEDSAYGYVTHAITIGPVRGDYEAAYEWGALALRVNEQFADLKRRAKIHQQFQAHVNLWRRPFATCIPHAREARQSGLQSGDFTYAGYGAATESWAAFLICSDLPRFVREFTPTLSLLASIHMSGFQDVVRVMLNWALALQGATADPLSLSNDDLDEEAIVAKYQDAAPFLLTFVHTARLHLAVLHGDTRKALAALHAARRVVTTGTIWPVLIDFWGALAAAAACDEAPAEQQAEYRRVVDEAVASLAHLATQCPENFRCFALLARAEQLRVAGQRTAAIEACEEAVRFAHDTNQVQYQALASEMAARNWLSLGRSELAAALLHEAHRHYAAWGASAKAAQLALLYPQWLGPGASKHEAVPPAGQTAAPAPPASLDMVAVLKAAQALAETMESEQLLRKLMRIALENAGAQRAVFLRDAAGELVVDAEASADPERVELGPASVDLPGAVIRYVARTSRDLVVGDAPADERFSSDPYVMAARPRSMLCMPIAHQGRVGGILYLENRLTAHAFTPDRIETMRILAAQTAISLENARLYGEMKALKNRLEAENVYLQEEIRTQHNFNEIVGNSPPLLDALHKVERVAPTDSTVLIVGETGTGKELFARAVHSRSGRSRRPLVKVNCGAIAPGLVESELFGHVKGAFTGAIDKRLGRFELADEGTIFLDEIGELPLDAQVKLLRVLQEQEFEPVGSSRTVRVNVRVIAATNRDLGQAVREGRFRADLLYRLNVFPIDVPPLRLRGGDLTLLVSFFVDSFARKLGKPLTHVSAHGLDRIKAYHWPGNVRELQNVIERAAILARGPVIDIEPLGSAAPNATAAAAAGVGTLEELERRHIMDVLKSTRGVVEGARGAASILGLHPNTLRSRMKKLGISARGAAGH